MTLHINLVDRADDRETITPLHNVVFEGGEPAPGVLVRCNIDGREVVGAVTKVEHEPADPPGTSTVSVKRVDEAVLTEDLGLAFLGEPPHATPATYNPDPSEPRHFELDAEKQR